MSSRDFKRLFEPGRIGTLEVKNRIVMPAMGNRTCGVWGEVTDGQIAWYRRRARGGCGPVIVEVARAATALDPIKVLTSTKVAEINDKGVVATDDKGNRTLPEADTVIIALDLLPSDSTLERDLKGRVKEVYPIGDAKSFQRIVRAISEGYVTAFNL